MGYVFGVFILFLRCQDVVYPDQAKLDKCVAIRFQSCFWLMDNLLPRVQGSQQDL